MKKTIHVRLPLTAAFLLLLTALALVLLSSAALAASTIYGTVTDAETDEPVEEADVYIYDPDNEKGNSHETTTDVEGYYEVTVDPGHYEIKIAKDGYETHEGEEDVGVEEQVEHNAELVPGVPTYLEGYITDVDTGDPIEGAEVTLTAEKKEKRGEEGKDEKELSGTTDSQGYYNISCGEGNYDIEITHADYETHTDKVQVEEGANSYDASLNPAGSGGGGDGPQELSGLPDIGNYNFVTLADVNNDTWPDIIASGAGRGGYFEAAPGGLHVFLNRNGTSFINGSHGLPGSGDEHFHATHAQLQLVDINNDSNPDIVAAEWLSHQHEGVISIYLGNGGSGGSMNWTRAKGPGLLGSWSGVACGDIDGDGHLDIVAGGAYGLNVWKGNHVQGDLNWTDASSGIPDSVHHVSGIQLADVNHDGRLDIVTGLEEGPGVQIYTCSETGAISWTEAHSGTPIADIGIVWDIALTSLDGDAHLDLIASGKNGIRAYLGNGNVGGRSAWWYDVSDGLPSSGTYYQLAIDDIDNDGKLDIGSALQVWSNTGNMANPDTYSWEGVGTGLSGDVSVGTAMGDLDLDGNMDIVCCGWETNYPGIHAFTDLTPGSDGSSDGGVPDSSIPGERVWFVKRDIMEKWTPRPDTEYVFVAMIGWNGILVENTRNDEKIGFENMQFKNTMGGETAETIMKRVCFIMKH